MLVEPLAAVDVNVPGAMAILLAPVAAQLSVLLAPELMLVGLAVKEAITGTEPLPGGKEEFVTPQPASPAQAIRVRSSEPTDSFEDWRPGKLCLLRQNEFIESMSDPKPLSLLPARRQQ
jgi:hypothetical protein